MNLVFHKLRIDGFKSFDKAELDLSNLGIVGVFGENNYEPLSKSNGSGKSGIFEAILWNLTGATSSGSIEVANTILNRGVAIILDFSLNEVSYQITRAKNHYEYGNALIIIKDGNDISGNTLTKSKSVLDAELGFINYDILTSIIILSQGLPGRLSLLKPASRKSRLEELSNTEKYVSNLQDKLNIATSSINGELNITNQEIYKFKSLINASTLNITSNNDKIAEIEEKSKGIISKETFEDYSSQVQSIDSNYKIVDKKRTEAIKSKSDKEYLLNSSLMRFNEIVNSNENLISRHDSISVSICPTCNQIMSDASKVDTMKSSILDEVSSNKQKLVDLNSSIENLRVEISSYKDFIDNYEEVLRGYKDELSTLNKAINEYQKFSSSTDTLRSLIQEEQSKIEGYESSISDLEKKLPELQEKIEIANYYKNQISRKFRSFLLEGIIEYMNLKASDYSGYLFKAHGSVELEIEGNNINIYLGDRRLEDLSGGEGRRVDIILQLIQRDLARSESGFTSNILVLDEVLDYLDSVGVTSVLSLLEYKSPEVDTMMIVSHKNDVDIPCDNKILVTKGEDQISTIA